MIIPDFFVGGGAFDAPAAQCFDFALVFGEYILLSAGPSRALAPTLISEGSPQIAICLSILRIDNRGKLCYILSVKSCDEDTQFR